VAANVKRFLNEMRQTWEYLPASFVTSAEKFTGGKQIRTFIGNLNEEFYKQHG
jgi:GTP-binding protein